MQVYSSAQAKYLAKVGQARTASMQRAIALAQRLPRGPKARNGLTRYAALRLGVFEALSGWYEIVARLNEGYPRLGKDLRQLANAEAELRGLLISDLIDLLDPLGTAEAIDSLGLFHAPEARRYAELCRSPDEPRSAIMLELELLECMRVFEWALLGRANLPADAGGVRYLRRSLEVAHLRIETLHGWLGAIVNGFPERLGEWGEQATALTDAFLDVAELAVRSDSARDRASPAHSPPAEPPTTTLR